MVDIQEEPRHSGLAVGFHNSLGVVRHVGLTVVVHRVEAGCSSRRRVVDNLLVVDSQVALLVVDVPQRFSCGNVGRLHVWSALASRPHPCASLNLRL